MGTSYARMMFTRILTSTPDSICAVTFFLSFLIGRSGRRTSPSLINIGINVRRTSPSLINIGINVLKKIELRTHQLGNYLLDEQF
jgi:hypothetical protein